MTKWEYMKIGELKPWEDNGENMTDVREIRAVFSDPKKEDIVFGGHKIRLYQWVSLMNGNRIQ